MMFGAQLTPFWQERSPRERTVLLGGTGLLIALVAYGLLWRPMQQDLARMDDQLPRLRTQAAQLNYVGDEIARLRGKAPTGSLDSGQLASLIERSALSHGLKVTLTRKDKTGLRMSVTSERTPFSSWLSWVDEMHRAHRIVLVSGKIGSLDTPGWVRIEIELAPAVETK